MIRLLILLALPPAAVAESYHVGEVLHHQLAVCISKESAVAVAELYSKSGFEVAKDLFNAKPDCSMSSVFGASVGLVVHSAKEPQGEKVSVAEIVSEGKVAAYFLTNAPVLARLEVVPKRGSNS